MKKLFSPNTLAFSLLIAENWASVYSKKLVKELGIGLPSLFVFKDANGHYLFRLVNEQKRLNNHIKTYFLQHKPLFLQKLIRFGQLLNKLSKNLETKSSRMNNEELWKCITRVLYYDRQILPLYIMVYYIANDKKLRHDFRKFIDKIDTLRLSSEGYYDRIDGFIRCIVGNRISKNLLRYYRSISKNELKNLLSGKSVDIERIKDRYKSNYCIVNKKIITRDITLSEYLEKNNFYYPPLAKQVSTIIIGQSIVAGRVMGRVRKIINKNNLGSIKRGEILVTTMTSPDFVPYLKKVSAIVTDYGGILCHAAIVARELNIPCVVGTENATRALKTGDLIELDARRGIVKVLKAG